MDRTAQFLVALAAGGALALISWQAGVLETNAFGGLRDSAAASGGPETLVSLGAAFVIGATMIVLPCGYPSVFVVPSILGSRNGLSQRGTLSVLFLAGSALPLAAFGVGLGFAGAGVLDLLDTMSARMSFAVALYSALGVLALGYALSEMGVIRLPSPTARITGPNLPDEKNPYRRALLLGGTFGAGLGIGCPMPTYYVLLGWVVASANPLYGAVLLGVYGLARVLPALGIGALIIAGMERRKVSQALTSVREKTSGFTSAVLTAIGAYLIVLFGGVVFYRVLAL
jgi:cytochrome c biogenesis protein CcdA